MKLRLFSIFAILLLTSLVVHSQKIYNNPKHLWRPIEDEVYLQEVSKKIRTENSVNSIAVFKGNCFTVMNEEIYLLKNGTLKKIKSVPNKVKRLETKKNFLWALTENGLYKFNNSWEKIDNRNYVDICVHLEKIYAATKNDVFRLENNSFVNIEPEGGYYSSNMTMLMEDGTQLHADPVRIGPIQRIESYSGTLYLLRYGNLALFDGKIVNQDFVDWGRLPSSTTRDLLSFGNRLFTTTDRGLSVLRGATLTTLKGKDGLPYENTTCIAKGFANDLWIGTTKGAVRMLNNDWHYFGADHWLPGDYVNDIAVGENIVYIATNKGIGIIKYEPYTLRKKAAYYERELVDWGHKRLGFIHTLYKKGNQWIREISDNDGGHTAPYLAAMCYKYIVTGDESAREEAVNSFKAMLWLERITPIKGFIARAIWSTTGDLDEKSKHGSGGLPAKWYPTKDGKWYWKGDTSSDEVTAHFYAVSIFHDLVAKGKEKELAKEHIDRMASYIIDNGWVLKDMDGKPTRWGRWNAGYLLRPYGWVDKGVNGLEAQAYAKAAFKLTNKEKYKKGFQQLMDWGYQKYTVRQKNTFPPEDIAPWDDELAFWSYYTLFRYTDEPLLKSVYLRSIERTWEIKRMEHIPFFNFTYGAISGNNCEIEKAVNYLREWKLECVEYNYTNLHRADLFIEPGYISYEGSIKAISPRESIANRNPISYDGRANGRRVNPPIDFLLAYWMGRYHGFITAPKTDDPDLISVIPNKNKKLGAKPYAGPNRPSIFN